MSKEHLITSYYWEHPSLIQQMDVEAVAGGKVRCRLIPRDGLDDGELSDVLGVLRARAMPDVYADVSDGVNVLMVPNLKNEERLLATLESQAFVVGTPKRVDANQASEVKGGNPISRAVSTIKGDTLKWSGRIGLAGHAAIFATGMLKKDANLAWGAMGVTNPIILSIYGNGKQDINFHEMMEKMRTYFLAEGIEMPPPDAPKEKLTLLKGVDKLLSTYPLQIGHSLGSIGAVNLMKSGLTDYRKGNRKALNLVYAGSTSLAGNGAVIFVPENKKSKDDQSNVIDQIKYGATHIPQGLGFALTKPTEVPGQAWNFVADSPLRFNGLLNAWDNVFWFIHAWGQKEEVQKHLTENQPKIGKINESIRGELDAVASMRAKGQSVSAKLEEIVKMEEQVVSLQKDYNFAKSKGGKLAPYLSFVTAFSFGMATFLSAISSKNRDSGFLQDEMYEQMYASAAKLLVQMPEADRADVLQRMSVFLSAQEEVQDGEISTDRIVEEVNKRVAVMEHSPWMNQVAHKSLYQPQNQGIA